MNRAGSPAHTPSVLFTCYNNIQCSRVNTPRGEPFVRPVIPVRGYWIPETPSVPFEYRAVFVKPPPSPVPRNTSPIVQYEYSTPRLLPSPPPPPPFYSPCVYNQGYSPHPHYQRVNRDIFMQKWPIQAIPTSNSFNEAFSNSYKLNPTESPKKYKPSTKTSCDKSLVEPKHKNNNPKYRTIQKNIIENLELKVKEKDGDSKYRYNELNKELHPELLAKWRKDLNKPKESLSTHKVKIEICLKEKDSIRIGTTKPNLNIEGGKNGKNIQEVSHKKIKQSPKERDKGKRLLKSRRLNNKMASSDSARNEKWSVNDELTPVPRAGDKTHSTPDNKRSALRFTPPQIHKVHKRIREDSDKSLLKRKNYEILIEEALDTTILSEKYGKSPTKYNSSNSDRDRSSESFRKSSLSKVESWKSSTDKFDKELNRGLETYRSRDEYSQSPARTNGKNLVSSRKSSFSALESHSSIRKFECDLNNDSDKGQNSSLYMTPEGTSMSTKLTGTEERQHSGFKRSLSEEYNDEGHSSNSSFNTSNYYTPESSPQRFNPAKRLKIRWSDSSSLSLDNSPHLNVRDRSSESSEKGVQPELIGYQMVGDSQFCRFGQQLLGLERVPTPNSSGRIGICVSGQTITDLHRRVKDNFYPISDKIILMIGTNDFLRNVNVTTMCEELSSLVKTLQKSASNIILLTLPPIPKLEKKNSTTHFKLLEMYNSHIRSLENGETLRIADISPLYVTPPPYQRCKMHLFEVFFNGPAKRLDLIHLNRCGLEIVRKYILDKFL